MKSMDKDQVQELMYLIGESLSAMNGDRDVSFMVVGKVKGSDDGFIFGNQNFDDAIEALTDSVAGMKEAIADRDAKAEVKKVIDSGTRLPKSRCVSCGHEMDGAFNPSGSEPSVGDVTVCIECGELMEFGEGMLLVELDADKIAEIDFTELQALRKAIMKAKEAKDHFNA